MGDLLRYYWYHETPTWSYSGIPPCRSEFGASQTKFIALQSFPYIFLQSLPPPSVSLGYKEVRRRFFLPQGLISSLTLSITSNTHTHTAVCVCFILSLDNRYWLCCWIHSHSRDEGSSFHAVTCCFWSWRGKPREVTAGTSTRAHICLSERLKKKTTPNGKNKIKKEIRKIITLMRWGKTSDDYFFLL